MLGAAGYSAYNVLAVLLPILMTHAGLAETNLGYLASAELTGLLVGSVCLCRIVRPGNSRALGIAAVAGGILTNLSTPWLHGIWVLILIRLLAGFAGGICTSLSVVGLGRFGNTSFNTAVYIAFSTLGVSVELLLFSYVEDIGGGAVGCYLVIVLFYVVSGLLLKWYPETGVTRETAEDVSESLKGAQKTGASLDILLSLSLYILLSIALYDMGMNGFFAYAGLLGRKQGFSDHTLTQIFNVLNILSLISSWVSVKVTGRFGPVLPLLVSLVSCAAAFGAIPTKDSPIAYAVLVMIVLQLSVIAQTTQVDLLLQYDPSGKAAALTPMARGIGSAIGPLLGSYLLAAFHGYRAQLVMESICELAAGAILALAFTGRNLRALSLPPWIDFRRSDQSE